MSDGTLYRRAMMEWVSKKAISIPMIIAKVREPKPVVMWPKCEQDHNSAAAFFEPFKPSGTSQAGPGVTIWVPPSLHHPWYRGCMGGLHQDLQGSEAIQKPQLDPPWGNVNCHAHNTQWHPCFFPFTGPLWCQFVPQWWCSSMLQTPRTMRMCICWMQHLLQQFHLWKYVILTILMINPYHFLGHTLNPYLCLSQMWAHYIQDTSQFKEGKRFWCRGNPRSHSLNQSIWQQHCKVLAGDSSERTPKHHTKVVKLAQQEMWLPMTHSLQHLWEGHQGCGCLHCSGWQWCGILWAVDTR